MPIYEYSCDKCGCEFEEIVKSDNNPVCPNCGSGQTSKLMSVCAKGNRKDDAGSYGAAPTGGCGSCSGGNCASCGR